MKWHGVVKAYEVPERFEAMLNNGAAAQPVTCAEVVEFYGWLRNAERQAISKARRNERRALERLLAGTKEPHDVPGNPEA